jgi:23S rRNA pseudouridine2605 synthase
MAQERLQKILARAGVSSRRAAEQLITGGRVRVNGAVVSELGARADTDVDKIEVDGKPVAREAFVYYLIHKPRGMVTTLKDPEDRPSLSELLHEIPERVYPVGRLDFHTSGALILTNDGDLAQALLHPSKAVPKTYVVKLSREVDDYMLNALQQGITLDDGYRTQPARVEHLRDEDSKSWLQITITEGKNRQIHRMIEALDTRVMRLSRLSFANISTEDLRPGNIRPLEYEEVAMLKRDYQGVRLPRRRESDDEPPRREPTRAARQGERVPRAVAREPRASSRAASRDVARAPERAPQSERPRTLGDRIKGKWEEREQAQRAPAGAARPKPAPAQRAPKPTKGNTRTQSQKKPGKS